MRAFEVEGIEKVGADLAQVVVGEILKIEKHPNADKLSIAKVDVGEKKPRQIVFGQMAKIEVGFKTPVALAPTILPGNKEIKKAELRGVLSEGMLCLDQELGLSKEGISITFFDKSIKNGTPVGVAMELDDALISIDVLANRAHDALSYVGMAREICALEGRKFDYKFAKLPKLKRRGSVSSLRVDVQDEKICPRYIGAILEKVEIKESPAWAKSVLRKAGLKPINNVVDATNYVMLELGQPTHAFDFDKIKSMEIPISKSQSPNKLQTTNHKPRTIDIVVRRAKKDEEIKLLDGSVKKLTAEDLVIADSAKAIALAGIMGGLDSGITNETKTIILEAANFDQVSIRKSRIRLGLGTDASARFEKGLDPNLAELAIARIIEILSEFGGEVADIKDIYPKKLKPWKIVLDAKYISRLLGETIAVKKITDILKSLELRIMKYELSKGKITVEVPTFRRDLRTQEDLIEEIGRIYGYEKIKARAAHVAIQPAKVNEERIFEREVKNILAGNGFLELYNYSFYSRRDAGLCELGAIKHLELQNPMNPDQELLRVSLIPNILKNIRENLKRFDELHFFEIGKVYWPARNDTPFNKIGEDLNLSKEIKESTGSTRHSVAGGLNGGILPEEKKILVAAIVFEERIKNEEISKSLFFEAKGYADNLLAKLGVEDQYYSDFNGSPIETFSALWHEGRRAEIRIEGQDEAIGYLGEINPLVLVNFDIHKRVAMLEIDLEKLRKVTEGEREYAPMRIYPAMTRDISMISGGDIRVDDILEVMQKAGGNLLLDADLFDIFDKDGKTSYAFRIIFGADDRTLKSEEVDVLMEKISADLEKHLGVKIRK